MGKAARNHLPLCVQVYDLVLDGVRRQNLKPGDALLGEVSLAREFGVSRTVLREALLLLEEDGHLVRNHGKRWTLAARRQKVTTFSDGLPILIGEESLTARRLQARVVESDNFTKDHLRTEESILLWETSFEKEGVFVCSSLEFMPMSLVPAHLLEAGQNGTASVTSRSTLLDEIGPGMRTRLSPSLWKVSSIDSNTERLKSENLSASAMPLLITICLANNGNVAYVAKNIVDISNSSIAIGVASVSNLEN